MGILHGQLLDGKGLLGRQTGQPHGQGHTDDKQRKGNDAQPSKEPVLLRLRLQLTATEAHYLLRTQALRAAVRYPSAARGTLSAGTLAQRRRGSGIDSGGEVSAGAHGASGLSVAAVSL